MDNFTLVTTGSVIAGMLLAGPILWLVALRRKRSKKSNAFTFGDAGSVVAWSMLGFGVWLLLGRLLGVRGFGMMHLLYIELAIVVPWTGLLMLLAARFGLPRIGRLKFSRGAMIPAWLSLIAIPLAIYTSFIEPGNLRLERTTFEIEGMSSTTQPITIAVLADLQFEEVTDHERKAVRMAMAAKPDLIILPGDVFQGSPEAFAEKLDAIRQLLAPLDATFGVYLVEGDTDRLIRRFIQGTKIRYLHNEIVTLDIRGTKLALGGIECFYDAGEARQCVRRLSADHAGADVRVLIAHRPDVVWQLAADSRIDLTIAGHTHGGQVNIPGFGPLITFSDIPRGAAAGGASVINGHRLYVSRGIGMERSITQAPPIRFNCPPEVSLLTLTGSRNRRRPAAGGR